MAKSLRELQREAAKLGCKLVPTSDAYKVVTVRMTPEMHSIIRVKAAQTGASMNTWCIDALSDAIDRGNSK